MDRLTGNHFNIYDPVGAVILRVRHPADRKSVGQVQAVGLKQIIRPLKVGSKALLDKVLPHRVSGHGGRAAPAQNVEGLSPEQQGTAQAVPSQDQKPGQVALHGGHHNGLP